MSTPPSTPPSTRPGRPVALITGATRGIGRAIAAELSGSHHVLVGGRDAARTAQVAGELESADSFVADLADEQAVAAAVGGIDRLDVLVHSAGLVAYGPIADAPTAQWREVLELNLVAPANLTRLLLPALREAHGLVVFLNSGAGLAAHPGFGVYAASKFGLTALADSLRAEERGGVRVTSVHPGRVATDMQAELNALESAPYRPERYLQPEAVAKAVRLAVDLPGTDSVRINPA